LLGQLETVKLKADLPEVEKTNYLNAAFQNAQQLQGLTDSLAEQTALDAPESSARKELIDLGDLVSDTVQGFEAKALAVPLTLRCNYPEHSPMVSLDARMMQRALNNLLDNAIRATPAGGTVELRIVCADDAVRIEVEDSGPGIPAEDRERIFERFIQGKVERSRRGSTGLGLAIVRRVAELHAGTARVAQDRATGLGGACFELVLPLLAAR
jgi:signal transduction histidine kinase